MRWYLNQKTRKEKTPPFLFFPFVSGGGHRNPARAFSPRLRARQKPPQSLGDGMLLSGGVKLYMDGSGGGRTAWVYAPWFKKRTEGQMGNTRYPNIDPQTYRQMVKLFHDAGIHVSTHAVADRAIQWS